MLKGGGICDSFRMENNYTAGQIIALKRDGKKLSTDQINWFIQGMLAGKIADFQTSALLMSIFLNGCDKEETGSWTQAMLNSGQILRFNDPKVIDKHSTGGVGDKTSLILGPIAAAAGVKIPMISGRGLGHTGGTLDKMEAIPGYTTSLPMKKFLSILEKTGIAIVGQSADLAPADKIIYNLRDLTGTVASIPLITASIMSKKLAEGTSGLVIDIKVGPGAFMKSQAEAKALAKSLRDTARRFDKNIITMITDMSQPLGAAIGNSNEVIESIETLKGRGPQDLTQLSLELAAAMIYLAKISKSMASARKIAKDQLYSGRALMKFGEMIRAQGGDPNIIQDYSLLPMAKSTTSVLAENDGHVCSIDVERLGMNVCGLGGGRQQIGGKIDHAVGIINMVKIGQKIKKNDVLAIIQHHKIHNKKVLGMAEEMKSKTYKIKPAKPGRISKLIQEVHYDLSPDHLI